MTPTKTRPHKPMPAEWTSEFLSLIAWMKRCADDDQTLFHPFSLLAARDEQLCLPVFPHSGCTHGHTRNAYTCLEKDQHRLLVQRKISLFHFVRTYEDASTVGWLWEWLILLPTICQASA